MHFGARAAHIVQPQPQPAEEYFYRNTFGERRKQRVLHGVALAKLRKNHMFHSIE
jgi:hypothetical protein